MVKKTITYADFDGVERTEDYHFNLTKSELVMMNWETDGGLEQKIKTIVDAKDNIQILKMFKEILKAAYGVKSADGKHFTKSDENWKNFEDSAAYDELLMELFTNADYAAEFIKEVLPRVDAPVLMPA